jgi:putative flippase GtrA
VKNRKEFFSRISNDQRLRYLLVGGINTIFGYVISNLVYYSFSKYLHILIIGIIANIICITFSFLTYKKLVFRTKENWLKEYFRCYLVYGLIAFIGIFAMWILVDGCSLPFWLSQGVITIFIVLFSYICHSRFSFKR